MSNIVYSGQFLDSKEFRLKIRTGSDIANITGNAVAGEMFLTTGVSDQSLYVCTETSIDDDFGIYKVADAGGLISGGDYNNYAFSQEIFRDTAFRTFIGSNNSHEMHFKNNSPLSISLWIKIDPRQKGSTFFARKAGNSYTYDLEWFYNPSNNDTSITVYTGSNGGGGTGDKIQLIQNNAPITKDKWHHFVLTYDGGTVSSGLKLYIDGMEQTNSITRNDIGSFTGMLGLNSSWAFGQRTNAMQYTLFGKYHEIAFFDAELTSAQVQGVYDNKSAGSYNPLYWWNFGNAPQGLEAFSSHGVNSDAALYLTDQDLNDDNVSGPGGNAPYELSYDSPHNNIRYGKQRS
jgi:hypothetical protein